MSGPMPNSTTSTKRGSARTKGLGLLGSTTPGYRRTATWWVISAKREVTRERRLAALIEVSAGGRRIDQLSPPTKQKR